MELASCRRRARGGKHRCRGIELLPDESLAEQVIAREVGRTLEFGEDWEVWRCCKWRRESEAGGGVKV